VKAYTLRTIGSDGLEWLSPFPQCLDAQRLNTARFAALYGTCYDSVETLQIEIKDASQLRCGCCNPWLVAAGRYSVQNAVKDSI
jgi:hypothetical protein